MVNTEHGEGFGIGLTDYNILNIVVNTELQFKGHENTLNYNILNIVVNTELFNARTMLFNDYNILNIVVNTEHIRR